MFDADVLEYEENFESEINNIPNLMCKLCYINVIQYMLVDCNHFCICESCVKNLYTADNVPLFGSCPICNHNVYNKPIKILLQ